MTTSPPPNDPANKKLPQSNQNTPPSCTRTPSFNATTQSLPIFPESNMSSLLLNHSRAEIASKHSPTKATIKQNSAGWARLPRPQYASTSTTNTNSPSTYTTTQLTQLKTNNRDTPPLPSNSASSLNYPKKQLDLNLTPQI
ncbi:hypothetical protein KC19_3G137800, partial [Ceratodon purpureus]